MNLDENEIVELIRKLLAGKGTDIEQEEWINSIKENVPFYEKIITLIFWSNEGLSANEIYERAKQEHKPIIL